LDSQKILAFRGKQKMGFLKKTTKLKLFSSTRIVRQPYLKLDENPFLNPEYFKKKYNQGAPDEKEGLIPLP